MPGCRRRSPTGDWRSTPHRNLVELSLRGEPDPAAVRREEGPVGPLGALDYPGLQLAALADHQPSRRAGRLSDECDARAIRGQRDGGAVIGRNVHAKVRKVERQSGDGRRWLARRTEGEERCRRCGDRRHRHRDPHRRATSRDHRRHRRHGGSDDRRSSRSVPAKRRAELGGARPAVGGELGERGEGGVLYLPRHRLAPAPDRCRLLRHHLGDDRLRRGPRERRLAHQHLVGDRRPARTRRSAR